MGGGKVTRPDFDMAQADANNPLTEFYALLQMALDGEQFFTLPGAYVRFTPPADEKLYAENIGEYCRFASEAQDGYKEIFAPYKLNLLYSDLRVAADGAPAALMLADEASHKLTAVQLLPPVALCALPKVPECTAAITLALTFEDMALADTNPAALGKQLAARTQGKQWLHHPRIEKWQQEALYLQQKNVLKRQRERN